MTRHKNAVVRAMILVPLALVAPLAFGQQPPAPPATSAPPTQPAQPPPMASPPGYPPGTYTGRPPAHAYPPGQQPAPVAPTPAPVAPVPPVVAPQPPTPVLPPPAPRPVAAPVDATAGQVARLRAGLPLDDQATVAGARRHDELFFRAIVGPSYLGGGADDSATTWKISGGGVLIDLALGWTVARDLIVYGELCAYNGFTPNSERKPKRTGTATQKGDLSSSLIGGGLGVGVAYFIQPANVHVGGGLLATRFSNEELATKRSGVGFGLNLNAGKDWWVADNFSLGVVAQGFYGRAEWFNRPFSAFGASAGLAATFN